LSSLSGLELERRRRKIKQGREGKGREGGRGKEKEKGRERGKVEKAADET
jgi:hypothetical protein